MLSQFSGRISTRLDNLFEVLGEFSAQMSECSVSLGLLVTTPLISLMVTGPHSGYFVTGLTLYLSFKINCDVVPNGLLYLNHCSTWSYAFLSTYIVTKFKKPFSLWKMSNPAQKQCGDMGVAMVQL